MLSSGTNTSVRGCTVAAAAVFAGEALCVGVPSGDIPMAAVGVGLGS